VTTIDRSRPPGGYSWIPARKADLSPRLIETAQRQAGELGLDLTLEVADCQSLPYEDASSDLSFEELDTRHDHHDAAEMWQLFRTS
jgi:hypothetical protein